jgi:hypothetical protein
MQWIHALKTEKNCFGHEVYASFVPGTSWFLVYGRYIPGICHIHNTIRIPDGSTPGCRALAGPSLGLQGFRSQKKRFRRQARSETSRRAAETRQARKRTAQEICHENDLDCYIYMPYQTSESNMLVGGCCDVSCLGGDLYAKVMTCGCSFIFAFAVIRQ